MLPPLIRRPLRNVESDSRQRGFTMAFVAITMVAIVSMAALAIDIGTLYEAKAEAQRAADAAALAAAQVISTSGITGDPTNSSLSWQPACGGTNSSATLMAVSVAQQNLIAGTAAPTSNIHVYYGTSAGVGTNTSCTGAGAAFGVNPVVEVYVQQPNLPTFFARIFSLIPGGTFSNSGVSATAAAEAFNPSGSSPMIPVQPRCVKPWMVPNQDPRHATLPFVDVSTGAIQKAGLSATGVIGETFDLFVDCGPSGGRRGRCVLADPSPQANGKGGGNTLDYIPGQVLSTSIAIAANTKIDGCAEATHNDYSKAVAGCDQTTVYACGVSGGNTVELTEDPGLPRNDSVNGAACLINAGGDLLGQGQDVLASYPFQIEAGSNSALVAAGISSGSQITSSPSIVSLPIYDNSVTINPTGTTPVTVIGFLQVFINSVNSRNGNINVTVMNIAGCGNGSTSPPVALGTSPVPVRLISIP